VALREANELSLVKRFAGIHQLDRHEPSRRRLRHSETQLLAGLGRRDRQLGQSRRGLLVTHVAAAAREADGGDEKSNGDRPLCAPVFNYLSDGYEDDHLADRQGREDDRDDRHPRAGLPRKLAVCTNPEDDRGDGERESDPQTALGKVPGDRRAWN
jgi:hypothetical protein